MSQKMRNFVSINRNFAFLYLCPYAKEIGEALWINNSNRSKSDELVKEWWKQ